YAALSAGSSDAASISSASRSRIAFAYSMRFRRWSVGRPGSGCSAATRSRLSSRDAATLSASALSGRGRPAGGIAPVRIFRTPFSRPSARSPIRAGSNVSSISPAVFSRWLWQVTQYLSSTARGPPVPAASVAAAGCRATAVAGGARAPRPRTLRATRAAVHKAAAVSARLLAPSSPGAAPPSVFAGTRRRTGGRTLPFLSAQLPQQHRGLRLRGERISVPDAVGNDQRRSPVDRHDIEARALVEQVLDDAVRAAIRGGVH